MARILVRRHGQQVDSKKLEVGQEYLVGRSKQCDIILEPLKGISRTHCKIFYDGESWVCEVLSKYGSLICEGESVESVRLEDHMVFLIPPYDFQFTEEIEKSMLVPVSHSHSAVNIDPGESEITLEDPKDRTSTFPSQSSGNLETTAIFSENKVAFLKLQVDSDDIEEVLRLEGEDWTAGRDPSCEIYLNDPRVSRKHFQIKRVKGDYFLQDLGSGNGTTINGHKIPKNEGQRILTGDRISIKNIHLTFEIYDSRFDNQLAVFDQAKAAGVQSVERVDQTVPPIKRVLGHKWGRLGLGLAAIIIFFFALTDPPPDPKQKNLSSNESGKFSELSREKQASVKDTFTLARNHFLNGRYIECIVEVEKLHEIIPMYENSSELEGLCRQAKELSDIQSEKERQTQQRRIAEEQIKGIVDGCRAQLKEFKTKADLDRCLSRALDLNAGDPSIQNLLFEFTAREEAKKEKAAQRKRYQARVRKGRQAYGKAKALEKKGKLAKAIQAYKAFLNADYPDPSGLRAKAKAALAKARGELDKKVTEALSECQKLLQATKYREAIEACDKARSEDPKNREVAAVRSQALSDLRREMKNIYEDAILEESIGNVQDAKEKWKKILTLDIKSGEYYRKAKIKLRKYGVEM